MRVLINEDEIEIWLTFFVFHITYVTSIEWNVGLLPTPIQNYPLAHTAPSVS